LTRLGGRFVGTSDRGQPQIGDIGETGGPIDLQEVDTPCPAAGSHFDQSQDPLPGYPPDVWTVSDMTGRVVFGPGDPVWEESGDQTAGPVPC
jgi:hypothetical protein